MKKPDYWSSIIESVANIFLIGKGASIDSLNLTILDDPSSLVINVNDSEHIVCGQIGTFSDEWVLRFSRKTIGACNAYVIPDHLVEMAAVVDKPVYPVSSLLNHSQPGFHKTLRQLEETGNEGSTVVLALDLVWALSQLSESSRDITIYLLGFDFSAAESPSSKIERDFSESDEGYRRAVFDREEEILKQILQWSRHQLNFQLRHVGVNSYSDVTPERFNQFSQKVSMVGDVSGLDAYPSNDERYEQELERVTVVAELTTNHCGDLDRLREMIALAKKSGADYVKVQKRNVDTFYSKAALEESYESPFGKTFGDYRRNIELDRDGFKSLEEACKAHDIGWFCSVLDIKSFEFVMEFSPQMLKLPSTVSVHDELLRYVAAHYFGDIVISTGYTDQSYEEKVLKLFANCKRIYLLQCISSYPTRQFDANVAVVRRYASLSENNPRVIPGYSSHDIGNLCSMLAVAAGARMIEKHVTIGDNAFLHFDHVAVRMDTGEFAAFVSEIRKCERILGSETKRVLKSEHHKYWLPPSS